MQYAIEWFVVVSIHTDIEVIELERRFKSTVECIVRLLVAKGTDTRIALGAIDKFVHVQNTSINRLCGRSMTKHGACTDTCTSHA